MKKLKMMLWICRHGWRYVALLSLTVGLVFVSGAVTVAEQETFLTSAPTMTIQVGEVLTYDISWSNILTAGTAVLDVKREKTLDGKEVFTFNVIGHSAGLLDKVFHVTDTARSVFDPVTMQSLSYSLKESYGEKKRRREMVFDRTHKIVISRLNDDAPETFTVPEQVQDILSALYYIRLKEDFTVDKPLIFDVHDAGKNWSVEVHTVGKEKIKTPAGSFDTMKLRTYPKYQGVFMNKGVVFLWLTDDARKIPVLMKSTLKVGSFVFTLTGINQEDNAH